MNLWHPQGVLHAFSISNIFCNTMIAQRLLWLTFMTYYNPDLFWLCTQTTWLRKTRLISKFLTSQIKTEIITLHILHNVSRSKGHQTRTFFQCIEYRMRNISLKNGKRVDLKKQVFQENKARQFFRKKWTFLTPWYAHIRVVCVWRVFFLWNLRNF